MTDTIQQAREVLASIQARVTALEHVHHDVPQSTLAALHNDLGNLEAIIERLKHDAPEKSYRVHLDSLDDVSAVLCFPQGDTDRNAAISDVRFTRAEWEALGRPSILDVGVKVHRG